MDSTQNINEYDETTQAAIRKIMFEQKQKVIDFILILCLFLGIYEDHTYIIHK